MDKTLTITRDLSLFPLFGELGKEQQMDFIKHCVYNRIDKNKHIYLQDDIMHSVYFLCQGKVKIYKVDDKGRGLIVSIYTHGEIFPYDSFLSSESKHTTNALAVEDSTFISISITDFEQLLVKYPKMSVTLLKMIGDNITDLQLRLENKMVNTIEEQVVKLLLQLSKNHGVTLSTNQILFLTSFQVKDLANMIGLSRETVSKVMTKLLSKNLVVKDNQGRLMLNSLLIREQYSINKW